MTDRDPRTPELSDLEREMLSLHLRASFWRQTSTALDTNLPPRQRQAAKNHAMAIHATCCRLGLTTSGRSA